MKIYCSKKLQTYLGQALVINQPTENSEFGDWNGHLFTIERKKCLIFMNNRTCYSVLMANVLKRNVKDLMHIFKERLVRQLDHDIKLTERQEIKVRKDLKNIVFIKSNNDKKIIGTINHHIDNLRCNNFGRGVREWDEVRINGILNDYLVGTKILADTKRHGDFFKPVELMQDLIRL